MWWRPIIYGILMWAVCIYVFRRGGWEERLCAAGGVVTSYLSPLLLNSHYDVRFQHLEHALLWVDIAYFLLIIGIVTRSRKFWPMWYAAISGMTVLGHLLPYMPAANPALYQNATSLWSYPGWIILAFAVRNHHRAMRRRAESNDGVQPAT